MQLTGNKLRNHSLDIARIVAILFVVMVHSSADFVIDYQNSLRGFAVGNFFDSLSRSGSAMFLMISGALMLDERRVRSTADMLKAALKLFVLTITWAVIYALIFYVAKPMRAGQEVNLKAFALAIINGYYHMWYLYMMIGIYLAVPILNKFVKLENKNTVLYFVLISLAATFSLPFIRLLSAYFSPFSKIGDFIGKLHMEFFGAYVSYFIFGWYIVHVGIDKKWFRSIIYVLGALSVLAILCITYVTKDYNNVYAREGILVFLYAISIFLLINNLKLRLGEKASERLAKLSKMTFGVYIIHPIFQSYVSKMLVGVESPLLNILCNFAATILLSLLASYILSYIPGLKKLIRG